MSALSTMSWTFTMMMKCWWSYFSDFDMCWRQHCLQCHGHSPWNVGWSYFSDFDVCWCQHCLQCHGLSPWNVGGHTSVTLTCEDVSIVYNVMDIHHEMLVVILQWLWRVLVSIVYNVKDIHHEMLVVILQWLGRVLMSVLQSRKLGIWIHRTFGPVNCEEYRTELDLTGPTIK
jgi:hypothetical protein